MRTTKPIELIEAGTLRVHVADAIETRRIQDADSAAKDRTNKEARLRRHLRDMLGVDYSEPFDQHEPVPVALIEGFRFTLCGSFHIDLAWLRACPDCKADVPRGIASFASLDESKEIRWPHKNGECVKRNQAPDPADTAEARFLNALRELIMENSYQG